MQNDSAQLTLESQDLLQLFIEQMPTATAMLDRTMRYLAVSQRWIDEQGLNKDSISCSQFHRFSSSNESPESLQQWKQLQQICLTGATETYEEAWKQENGRLRWSRWKIHPWRDRSGEIGGLILCCEDITEQKQTEADLRESQQLLQLVMDSIPQHIFWKNQYSVYLGCNRNFAEAAGVESPENIVGKTDYDLPWKKDESDWYRELDRQVMTANAPQYRVIEPQLYADGTQHWSETNKVPLHNEEGKVVGILGTFEDVTERIMAEEGLRQSEAQLRQQAEQLEHTLQELRQTQSQLIQTEKMSGLGQLVAGVAHEINNPVNFIYGNLNHANEYTQDLLQLLKLYQKHYPTPDPEIQAEAAAIDLDFLLDDLPKLLTSMQVGANRIRDIVLALRNFSRMDEAELKPVNLHEGIDSTLMILQNRLKQSSGHSGIEVIKEYGKLPQVECYAGQLNQVFMNILSNAIDVLEEGHKIQDTRREIQGTGHKARDTRDRNLEPQTPNPKPQTPNPEPSLPPPTITIRTEVINNKYVRICIADNGPGMTEAVQRRLFEPFFTTKSVGKGTGLGLSISYQVIVDKHNGTLTCNSAPGKGAKFVIELPLVAVSVVLSTS